jgi:excisionase family DNA binding protein
MNDHEFGPRLYSIAKVKARLGIGNTTLYQEISAGRLVALKIGARTLVTSESLAKYIEELPRADVSMKLPPRYAAAATVNK